MPSPFPGMNPYLESQYWRGVHHWMISGLAQVLNQNLPSQYYAAVEVRIYETSIVDETASLVGIPDNVVLQDESPPEKSSNIALATISKPVIVTVPMTEEVKEGFLEIRETASHQVITAIEVLSPKNKQAGTGREKYEEKRRKVLSSGTHLVEIDLIRRFRPMEFIGPENDYRILVSRSQHRPSAELYGFNLQDAIPVFPVPLKSSDSDIPIDLKQILDQLYDTGAYDRQVDYRQAPPLPKLSNEDQLWVDQVLKAQGLRSN